MSALMKEDQWAQLQMMFQEVLQSSDDEADGEQATQAAIAAANTRPRKPPRDTAPLRRKTRRERGHSGVPMMATADGDMSDLPSVTVAEAQMNGEDDEQDVSLAPLLRRYTKQADHEYELISGNTSEDTDSVSSVLLRPKPDASRRRSQCISLLGEPYAAMLAANFSRVH
jgi:hypothetical protein